MDNILIQAHSISKAFGSTPVLKNISLSIEHNTFCLVLGKSGSGKTTLLSVISGLEHPDNGEVIISGTHMESMTEEKAALVRRNNIGFIFQSFNLIPSLTALDNVMMPLIPVTRDKKSLQRKALSLMKHIGIDHRCNNLPSQLSGGERQRTAIARALINDPKMVFADEPTGNLDTSTGNDVIQLLLKLKKENGISIVMVSHNEEYARYADSIITLKDGEVCNG